MDEIGSDGGITAVLPVVGMIIRADKFIEPVVVVAAHRFQIFYLQQLLDAFKSLGISINNVTKLDKRIIFIIKSTALQALGKSFESAMNVSHYKRSVFLYCHLLLFFLFNLRKIGQNANFH